MKLRNETAGPFVRQVFPWYFLAVAIVDALAVLAFAPAYPGPVLLAGVMALVGALNRPVLMPRINCFRDRMLAGDVSAGGRFDRLHRASVGINLLQPFAAGLA